MCALFVFGFGVVTIPLLILQGALLGFQSGMWFSAGQTGWDYFLLIFPHGMIEIPALIISSALGLVLWSEVRKLFQGEDVSMKQKIFEHKKKYWLICSMVFFAACIECFITPKIFELLR